MRHRRPRGPWLLPMAWLLRMPWLLPMAWLLRATRGRKGAGETGAAHRGERRV